MGLGVKDKLLLWTVFTLQTSCGISTARATLCPPSQWLLPSTVPSTHTILGLEGGLSGWETLRGFFAQNKGPLSGSSLLGVGPHSHSWDGKGVGGKKGRQEISREKEEKGGSLKGYEGLGRKYNLATRPIRRGESCATGQDTGFCC